MSTTAGEGQAARPSLVDGAERALRNWLAPGRYRQGDRLPPEHEVAAMLGVSRGTLRSALQRLEESGEIVRRQGSGTFVGRMAVPTAFGERLERLEPYSSVARRRGVSLAAIDVSTQRTTVRPEACEALGLEPDAEATVIGRTLVADGTPVAVMYDVVHPSIELPEPRLLSGRERPGKQLQIRGTTACLELEELIFAGRDDRVAYSRDLFAPGGIEVMVMRSLDSPAPARVAADGGPGAERRRAGRPRQSRGATG